MKTYRGGPESRLLWPAGPEEKLGRWVRIRSVWRKVGDVDMYGLNYWTHVCFILDTKFRDVKISINGEEPISITDEEIMIEAPNDLKNGFKIGQSDQAEGPKQFVGSITNIKFFEYHEKLDIKEVTKNLCIFRENLWADSQWLTYGKIEETVADEGDVCRQSRTYQISAPINMSWIEAIETCRKLGSGKMTEIQDQDHLDYTVRRFNNLKDQCEAIWTPLTDENVEGKFVSEITGELAGFLPWDTLEKGSAVKDEFLATK